MDQSRANPSRSTSSSSITTTQKANPSINPKIHLKPTMPSNIFINPHRKPAPFMPHINPEIRTFHQSLPQFSTTPLHSLPTIASDLGVSHVLLKDESYRLGLPAFKILGASWATAKAIIKRLAIDIQDVKDDSSTSISLERLGFAAQASGLVLFAATDGNHGRAVARMARYLGIQARVFVPGMLDAEARGKIEGEGAVVVVFDGDYDQTVLGTKNACEEYPGGKGVLISDTALVKGDEAAQWIVDGYQTMFDEVAEQVVGVAGGKAITHIFSPVGVGSLSQAVVTHVSRVSRGGKVSVVTVEPESAACLKTSLEAGEMVSISAGQTICSGLCCGTLSLNGWEILRDGVAAAITVSDELVDQAVRELSKQDIQAGPCGAATLAGLRELVKAGGLNIGPESVVLVLCTEGTRGYTMAPEKS